jgi:fructose-bisphosphate aldolase class I
MNIQDELQATISAMVQRGKGILAADESTPTITKRFNAVSIESNEETRRAYRQMLLSTPDIGEFISGVILFEETLGQKTGDGTPLVELAQHQGIVPGIKVDKGLVPLANALGDKVTRGLDGLGERLVAYKAQGARFAKWRAVYAIGTGTPSLLGMQTNAELLARYAAICQQVGMVPIVEPEVLIDGDHSVEQCETVTEAVQHEVFHALKRHHVKLEAVILKPNMVVPGKAHPVKASPEEVAERTLRILRRTVAAAVPSINFLSGGLTPQEATANLNAMNADPSGQPWMLSFSYARALQEIPMSIWQGKPENAAIAQQAFMCRARLNGLAQRGEYEKATEQST